QLFLEGRQADLARSLRGRMERAAQEQEYESAAKYRDLISTVEDLMERQRMATVQGDDMYVFGFHYENEMLAVNLFHMRGGRILDRRELFWEELPEFELIPHSEDVEAGDHKSSSPPKQPDFDPGLFFCALLKQVYIDQQYVPR